MIENQDGTVTITRAEVLRVHSLNARLSELGIRAKAARADRRCASSVEEIGWGDLYPRIVNEAGSRSGVTIRPSEIPANHTLVLAAERVPERGDHAPAILMRLMLVRGSGPARVGESFKQADPLKQFTTRAREAVRQARKDAADLRHPNVGPEHLLLALLREPGSDSARVLNSLGITFERVRDRIVELVQPAAPILPSVIPVRAPFTPRAAQVLELALLEASSLASDQVDDVHLLLALGRQHLGVATRIMCEYDADPEKVRIKVDQLIRPDEPSDPDTRY